MSKALLPFVAFGSDTDCDGTSFYACGVLASDLDSAREALREDFGGMTFDGIHEILPYTEALRREPDVRGIMEETYDHGQEWDAARQEWVSIPPYPFRYRTLGVSWQPWAGPDGDDSIGIPALDSTYDEPMLNWE